jgi:hypothetical protein
LVESAAFRYFVLEGLLHSTYLVRSIYKGFG